MRVSVDEWGWGVRVSCVNRKIGAVWRFSLLVSGEVVASWVVRSQARPQSSILSHEPRTILKGLELGRDFGAIPEPQTSEPGTKSPGSSRRVALWGRKMQLVDAKMAYQRFRCHLITSVKDFVM